MDSLKSEISIISSKIKLLEQEVYRLEFEKNQYDKKYNDYVNLKILLGSKRCTIEVAITKVSNNSKHFLEEQLKALIKQIEETPKVSSDEFPKLKEIIILKQQIQELKNDIVVIISTMNIIKSKNNLGSFNGYSTMEDLKEYSHLYPGQVSVPLHPPNQPSQPR
jgi:N12 class adenine-specific DNA methylase